MLYNVYDGRLNVPIYLNLFIVIAETSPGSHVLDKSRVNVGEYRPIPARQGNRGWGSSVFIKRCRLGAQHVLTTVQSTMAPTSLDDQQKEKLQETLDELAQVLPGCFLTLVTPTETLFNGQSGKFDMLKSDSRDVTGEDVMWFASTTKLITSVCESTSPMPTSAER
jgi:hypothetical protein